MVSFGRIFRSFLHFLLARLMRACDMVVLASPVYWANVPAAVKNLFDRFRGTAMEETKTFPKPRFSPNQRFFLLTACNTPAPFSFLMGQSVGAKKRWKNFSKPEAWNIPDVVSGPEWINRKYPLVSEEKSRKYSLSQYSLSCLLSRLTLLNITPFVHELFVDIPNSTAGWGDDWAWNC